MRTFAEVIGPWAAIGPVLLLSIVIVTLRGSTVLPARWDDRVDGTLIATALGSFIGFVCCMLFVLSLYLSSGS
jgi:hypothetical protein